MRDLFVHIGAHKTGTTAVQEALANGRSDLAASSITYPNTNWCHYSQHRLAFATKGLPDPMAGDKPELETEAAALCKAIASAETDKILISSEEFFSAKRPQIERLANLLTEVNIHIIAFVRRPDTFLLSMYNQKTKHPGNRFYNEISAFVADPFTIDADIAFNTCIRNWTSVFGTERTTLCVYEDGDPLEQILQVLGAASGTIAPSPRINQSVPGAVVEAMRLSKLINMHPDKQAKLYQVALTHFQAYPPFSLSRADREAIMAALEPETTELFAKFGRENPYMVTNFHPESEDDVTQPVLHMKDLMVLIGQLL